MSHLTHLKTFLEVYRTGSFSRAAQQLGITQPAASLHIQSLEALVGKPLFIRKPRGVEATEVADELARAISPHLDELDAKLTSLRSPQNQAATLHLAGPPDFVHYRLGAVVAPLLKEGYRIRFHPGNKERIYSMLDEERVDLAITASMPDSRQYGYAHLLTERMLLVHAPALTHAIGSTPTAASLSAQPLIAFDEALPLVRLLWTTMFQVAPEQQAAFTIPDLRIIKEMVIDGHGWTVLPDYHCESEIRSGLLVSPDIVGSAPTNDLYLVWHKGISTRSAAAFVRDRILQSFARK